MQQRNPTLLIILDGFGISEDKSHNAIANANTPQWDMWWQNCPHTTLDASGIAVGLPELQMGNSEVGHMHIGAGRTILQSYTFINDAIANGSFANNPIIVETCKDLQTNDNALHIIGLLSEGGVHSHQQHLFALLEVCAQNKLKNVYLHLFLDGRDTPPQSALQSIAELEKIIAKYQTAMIASISGRYYAMDRDKRWERIEPVYNLLTQNKSAHKYTTPQDALDVFYAQEIFDEFIPPTKIGDSPAIKDEDSIFFFNFRADRARELTQAFIAKSFDEFHRDKYLNNINFITMSEYSEELKTKIVFPPNKLNNTLGEVIAKHNLKQLRIAETEKYAHVTFFLNGGNEVKFANEDRVLVPSPQVATYDLKPEMSANELTEKLISAINDDLYDVIICNYANPDMVGHTGNFAATVKAIEAIDACLQKLGEAIKTKHGQMLITADHGNAEQMFDLKTQQPHTAHTSEHVPLLYVGERSLTFKNITASLSDIAPTLLKLLGITPPQEMSGRILLDE